MDEPRRKLPAIFVFSRRISRFSIWVAGAVTLLSAMYISVDVLLRKFMASSAMGGSDELTGYIFAASITWALAYTTLERANIRIDSAYQLVAGRWKRLLDFIAFVALFIFVSIITYYAIQVLETTWERASVSNSVLAIPLWIPQLAWVLGLVWCWIAMMLIIICIVFALMSRDVWLIQRMIGIRNIEEETAEEISISRKIINGGSS